MDAHQLGINNKDGKCNKQLDRSTGICAKEERACHGHCRGVALGGGQKN